MCTMLYMASDQPLPEIAWDEAKPAFFVTSQLHPKSEEVRGVFSKPHVYYVGSDQYCGCGFAYCTDAEYELAYDGYPDILAKALDDNARGRDNIRRLRDYLGVAVEISDIELYAVNAGGESKEPLHKLPIGPDYFTGEECGVMPGQFFELCKSLGRMGL